MRGDRGWCVLLGLATAAACGGEADSGGADGGPPDAAACSCAPFATPASDPAANAAALSLASDGCEIAVAWADARDGETEIYFARVGGDGAKLGADVRVTNSAGTSQAPSLVWNGSGFGLAWSDGRDGPDPEIYFVALDPTGAKLTADLRITNAPALSLGSSLVWTGSEYGLAWHDLRDGDPEIYFARLAASGEKIGGD